MSTYHFWDKAKFDQAASEGKTIYLEFSASWCKICKAQEEHVKAAFEELDNPNVIGFKIPYNDDQTTEEHKNLAKQYQIAYQHTKVILKDGKVVLKSPEAWEHPKIIAELKKIG